MDGISLKIDGYVDLTVMALQRLRNDAADVTSILIFVTETDTLMQSTEDFIGIIRDIKTRAGVNLPSIEMYPVGILASRLQNVSEVLLLKDERKYMSNIFI